jgi:hypothetical protein
MYKRLRLKYPLFLLGFNETWIFLTVFRMKAQKTNFVKIHPFEADLFMRTDRHDEANSRFSRFCERAKLAKIPIVYAAFAVHVV